MLTGRWLRVLLHDTHDTYKYERIRDYKTCYANIQSVNWAAAYLSLSTQNTTMTQHTHVKYPMSKSTVLTGGLYNMCH